MFILLKKHYAQSLLHVNNKQVDNKRSIVGPIGMPNITHTKHNKYDVPRAFKHLEKFFVRIGVFIFSTK